MFDGLGTVMDDRYTGLAGWSIGLAGLGTVLAAGPEGGSGMIRYTGSIGLVDQDTKAAFIL